MFKNTLLWNINFLVGCSWNVYFVFLSTKRNAWNQGIYESIKYLNALLWEKIQRCTVVTSVGQIFLTFLIVPNFFEIAKCLNSSHLLR